MINNLATEISNSWHSYSLSGYSYVFCFCWLI
nr:MAG TPA: hypothetical protein [Caudoviricetes sp.]